MSPDFRVPSTPVESAAYIADVTKQLETLANEVGLSLLAYLLSMAREEAMMQRHDCRQQGRSSA